MLKRSYPAAVLIVLSGALVIASVACTRDTSPNKAAQMTEAAAASPTVIPASPPAPTRPPAGAPNLPDPYKLALDKADSARNISESAQSQDDWSLVASRWQQAIQLLQKVPSSSPYRSMVKSKVVEYQRSLVYAKKQAARAGSNEIAIDPDVRIDPSLPSSVVSAPVQTAVSSASPSAGRVFRVRIKRRAGGTPVIDVTFNGRQTFEMIVDTGASGTVITEQMAAALGVNVIGKAKVDTASARDVEVPLAYVNSISVGGAAVKGVVVAIGNSALDIGLLGHDFFSDYDVTIKRDVVEFRQR